MTEDTDGLVPIAKAEGRLEVTRLLSVSGQYSHATLFLMSAAEERMKATHALSVRDGYLTWDASRTSALLYLPPA